MIAVRVVIAGIILLPTDPLGAAVCDDIDRVIAHAASDFRDIRGAADPDIEDWYETSFNLPGGECVVSDEGRESGSYYKCDWTFEDEASARSAYDDLKPTIGECLDRTPPVLLEPRQVTIHTALIAGQRYPLAAQPSYELTAQLEYSRSDRKWGTTYRVEFLVRKSTR